MKYKTIIAAATLAAGLTSCSVDSSAVTRDKRAAGEQLDRLTTAQPAPSFGWSQIRQNLIDITQAQADTTQTTAFFFNMGTTAPIASCPSIGYPIPTTAQLTNPSQTYDSGVDRVVIPQVEQTGIYTGDSTGTYVMCVDAEGEAYAFYWEGFVATVSGPAVWDSEAAQIKLIGPPSFDFSEGQ